MSPQNDTNATIDINLLAAWLLGIGCAAALFLKLQWFAIVALLLLMMAIYKQWTRRFATALLKRLSTPNRSSDVAAEDGLEDDDADDVEFHTLFRLDPTERLSLQNRLSALTPTQIEMLARIHEAGEYTPVGAVNEILRVLDERGLLSHNGSSVQVASKVWLTKIGKRVGQAIAAGQINAGPTRGPDPPKVG